MKNLLIQFFLAFNFITGFGQDSDSLVIRSVYDNELLSEVPINNLRTLCKKAPGRLAGSPASFIALNLIEKAIQRMGPDTVYRQQLEVYSWNRGKKEEAIAYLGEKATLKLHALAIGGSISTGINGIKSTIVEVHSFEELKKLGSEKIKGKIVFFNQPMDPKFISPSPAYGSAVYQRVFGASEAARYGAIGVVVRSMTLASDYEPHTGIMHYVDTIAKIPAICISTLDADSLSKLLKTDASVKVFFKTDCNNLPAIKSYNIVAEIKGSVKPGEIITVGAHIDCWDVCEGAQDDGAGCIHVMEVLRLFHELGIKPKRTIRVVIFMDEEMHQSGAKKYAETVKQKNEKIYAAYESDSGSLLPLGFGCMSDEHSYSKFLTLEKYFKPYSIYEFYKGHGDVDVYPLKDFGVPLLNLHPDMQRYFDYHHSINDRFEAVHPRELKLCSAATASLIYLIDKLDIFTK
jgi:carboxypeptidase Q